MAWHVVIQRHTGRVKLENVGIVGMAVMAWHGVIQRHTGRVKFENVGIVGMAVLWLGMG